MTDWKIIGDDYQEQALKTAQYPEDAGTYLVVAMLGELGELSNVYKKELRDGVKRQEKMYDEAGDVFWYLAMLCQENGWFTLGDILELVIFARTDYPRSVKPLLLDAVADLIKIDDGIERHGIDSPNLRYSIKRFAYTLTWLTGVLELDLESILWNNIAKLKERSANNQIKDHA